jgi:plasmid stability protein
LGAAARETNMSGLLIKNVPPELHQRLRERAARNRRSLTQEALSLLEVALNETAGRPALPQLDRRRVRGARAMTDTLIRRAKAVGRP